MSICAHDEKVRATRLRMRFNCGTDVSTCCIDNIQHNVHTMVRKVLRKLYTGPRCFNPLSFLTVRRLLCGFQNWKRVCNGPGGGPAEIPGHDDCIKCKGNRSLARRAGQRVSDVQSRKQSMPHIIDRNNRLQAPAALATSCEAFNCFSAASSAPPI